MARGDAAAGRMDSSNVTTDGAKYLEAEGRKSNNPDSKPIVLDDTQDFYDNDVSARARRSFQDDRFMVPHHPIKIVDQKEFDQLPEEVARDGHVDVEMNLRDRTYTKATYDHDGTGKTFKPKGRK